MNIEIRGPLAETGPVETLVAGSTATAYRKAEKIALAYFAYIAAMVSIHPEPRSRYLLAWVIPVALWAAIAAQARFSAGWNRVTRDWASLALILVAYRELDWFAGRPPLAGWQQAWIGWDRYLLNDLGLRAALEHFGPSIPSGLEAVYLSLYGIPALCMGALYWNGRRSRIDTFLTTLFLGTLCAYALLPLFPVPSPRLAYPNADLPGYTSVWRTINVWLLNHCDISTGVFPSGHVAVAFSSAFGLIRALPDRRWLCAGVFSAAVIVFTATVYCRYHYVTDGLASIGISVAAWLFCEVADRNA